MEEFTIRFLIIGPQAAIETDRLNDALRTATKLTAIVRDGKTSTGLCFDSSSSWRLPRQEGVGLMRYRSHWRIDSWAGRSLLPFKNALEIGTARYSAVARRHWSPQVQPLSRKRKKPTADRVCVGLTRRDDVSLGFRIKRSTYLLRFRFCCMRHSNCGLRVRTRILNAEHHLTEFVVTDRYLQLRLAARTPRGAITATISSSDQVISI